MGIGYAEALALGWRVLRVTPKHVTSGQALTWITRLLAQGGGRVDLGSVE